MNPLYIEAIETQLKWIKHANTIAHGHEEDIAYQKRASTVMPMYKHVLEVAQPFFMDAHFCSMVDHARMLTPDALTFSVDWMHTDNGFLYCEEPFYIPPIEAAVKEFRRTGNENFLCEYTRVRAIGWFKAPEGSYIPDNGRVEADLGLSTVIADHRTYVFVVFLEFPHCKDVWYPWSHFALKDGMELGWKVRDFETLNTSAQDGDNYVIRPEDTTFHPLHEVRWIYTAMYLMAQQLTARVQVYTDRATRRRAARNQQTAPPLIQVVTLRKKKIAHIVEGQCDVNWQWQWHVRGHWRNHWYPHESIHKPVFIEAYMKGPEDKPVKPPTIKLFAAVR